MDNRLLGCAPLTENQQAALISFIFNCGAGAFQASTLQQKLNRGEYANAANELLR
ncbi:glycoside hydrolase family protein [Rickettsia rickettsii]|nr:glycoside hydrolase family protein [Rickettsia philipii]